MPDPLSHGFPPIAPKDGRVLVLGSLPGGASLEKQQYYGQPRNAFWTIMGVLCGATPELDYPERIRHLERARVVLWDVIAAAERPGSLDSSIVSSTMQINDFASLFGRCRQIERVFFNGAKAAELYRRRVLPLLGQREAALPRIVLPSTSPANARLSTDDKLAAWTRDLGDHIAR